MSSDQFLCPLVHLMLDRMGTSQSGSAQQGAGTSSQQLPSMQQTPGLAPAHPIMLAQPSAGSIGCTQPTAPAQNQPAVQHGTGPSDGMEHALAQILRALGSIPPAIMANTIPAAPAPSAQQQSASAQAPASTSGTQKAKEQQDTTWFTPNFRDTSDCMWKSTDLVNKWRHAALCQITNKLHAFRTAYMDAEVDQSIYKAFNDIVWSLQRELQIIHIADQSEHGWAIMREMDSHQSVTDLDLEQMLTKANTSMKCKRNEGTFKPNKQPFRGRSGGSASFRPQALQSYPQLHQWPGAPPQFPAPSQQYGPQYSAIRPPPPYPIGSPGQRQLGLRCFSCLQTGHFQKSYLNSPRTKDPSK